MNMQADLPPHQVGVWHALSVYALSVYALSVYAFLFAPLFAMHLVMPYGCRSCDALWLPFL
jgi:hypothetical protein